MNSKRKTNKQILMFSGKMLLDIWRTIKRRETAAQKKKNMERFYIYE